MMNERWHDFIDENPVRYIKKQDEVIEIMNRKGDDPWLEPMRVRYCDIPTVANVHDLSWRRIVGG